MVSGPAARITWELIRSTNISGAAPDLINQKLLEWGAEQSVLTSPPGDADVH